MSDLKAFNISNKQWNQWEVNRVRGNEVHYGKKRVRRSFSRIREVMEIPNLIEIQSDSYQWFLDEGLKEVFADIMRHIKVKMEEAYIRFACVPVEL